MVGEVKTSIDEALKNNNIKRNDNFSIEKAKYYELEQTKIYEKAKEEELKSIFPYFKLPKKI